MLRYIEAVEAEESGKTCKHIQGAVTSGLKHAGKVKDAFWHSLI